jgi:hypothetical protein
MSFKVASAATALLGTAMAAQKINYTLTGYNDLAITPQMGWDNWNALGCDVSEDLLLDTANKMVHIGLRDVGYNYVILDDCWNTGRYENGSLRPDAGESSSPVGVLTHHTLTPPQTSSPRASNTSRMPFTLST